MPSSARAYNPILPGFHPDPSIVRVGDDFYIATSTFEWYPGVLIYHSRDLARWTLVAAPLDRPSLLDLRGRPDSCGVWAPCLSHDGERFFLVYTDVRKFEADFKDAHNYVTHAVDIKGPWSERTYLNSSGFDPSLFHDADGKKWLVNMVWDHRPQTTRVHGDFTSYFGGILLQQYDPEQGRLIGEVKRIFHRGLRGASEGPHLYRRGNWYYLLVAEGGTDLDHAALFARAEKIDGPYEIDPEGYILTATPSTSPLLRAGHASLVDAPSGDWFLAHLCSRHLPGRARSVMGRETAIQAVQWSHDGWPRLAHGDNQPKVEIPTGIEGPTEPPSPVHDRLTFDRDKLPLNFQSLRFGLPEDMLSLQARAGWLRLFGRESLGSTFEQSLVARRQTAFTFRAETRIDFQPSSFQQMAGLVCYYGHDKYIYLHVTHDETLGRVLDVAVCLGEVHTRYPLFHPIQLPKTGDVWLNVYINYDEARLSYGVSEGHLEELPLVLDYSYLSDEAAGGAGTNFTGAFVGMCCQDLTGTRQHADFGYFDYIEVTKS